MTTTGHAPVPGWAGGKWGSLLTLYPPLLPYKELGAVVDGKPSDLFDQFDPLLGLGALDGATSAATKRAKEAADRVAEEARCKTAAVEALEASPDLPGAGPLLAEVTKNAADLGVISSLATQLAGEFVAGTDVSAFEWIPVIDLNDVEAKVTGINSGLAELQELEKADVSRNEQVAELLTCALKVHQPGEMRECPVCHSGTLDDAWREDASARVEELRAASAALTSTRRQIAQRVEAVRSLLTGLVQLKQSDLVPDSAALIDRIATLRSALSSNSLPPDVVEQFRGLSSLVESCRAAATGARNDAADRALPIVQCVLAWVEAAQAAAGAADEKRNYTKAAEWLKQELQRLRDLRLAAIDGQAHAIWGKLRQTCSVELGPLVLEGAKTRRRLALTCTTEGKPAMARSILSQGELHAIALSLFLPRATHASSPFGFIAIDDPVQALDRAKVDGLAEVLSELAERRQVIVFTHDDRLPDAVLRLGLSAEVVRISRSDGSTVKAEYGSDQVERALSDAYTLARDEEIDPKYALRAIAGCCRAAVEAKALQSFRRSKAAQGKSVDEIDELLKQSGSKFWDRISLGVFGEVRPQAKQAIEAKFGVPKTRVLSPLNRSGHELLQNWAPLALVQDTRAAISTVFGS